ncbi:MAG: ROK family protein [Gudongella sp.]|jgi:glucokinase|nr:ROK family protein [Gudongella sp.]
MKEYILGIDIGGSKYAVGIFDTDGNLLEANRHPWSQLTVELVLNSIIKSSKEIMEKNKDKPIKAVGVTIPGLADPEKGIWVEASFSGLGDIKIAEILNEEFGVPVFIDNDAQACALAEKMLGSCKDNSDFLYLTVSNGVGGAVFADDKLYYGGFGHAGEIGHVVVVEDGHRCNCGNDGCLEMYAAGPGIVRNYRSLGGAEVEGLDAKYISELALSGDEIALKTFELEGYYLGKAIGAVCNVLNPEKVVIGGGVSLSFSLFEDSLNRILKKSVYQKANEGLIIEPSPFGYNGGLYGAAALALRGIEDR